MAITASRTQSMTGYGRASRHTKQGTVIVELRSTNHRFLEVDSRLPGGLSALQGRLADVLRGRFRRGRVEVTVSLHAGARDARRVVFDDTLLSRYHRALADVKRRFKLADPITLDHLLALPQAVSVQEDRLAPEALWEPIRLTAQAAVEELARARSREGARLVTDIRAQMAAIEKHAKAITARLPKALAEQHQQLRQRLQELLGHKSAASLGQLQEAVALVRDADVHEELVRIASHLAHIRQTLTGPGLAGKQLDFIAQELMRETNTIGAKVNDGDAARHVVELKGCIEKIREQVQNLE